MRMILVHIVKKQEIKVILERGKIEPSSPGNSLFVHCCLPNQVDGVLEKWFSGENDLYAVEIDSNSLSSKVVFENLEGGEELFPHIYGDVPIKAVKNHYPVKIQEGGYQYENRD